MTSPTWSPVSLARSSRLAMTAAPSSGAGVLESVPPNLPTAVRAAATMTMSVLMSVLQEKCGSSLFFHVATGCGLDRLPFPVARRLGRGDLLAAERTQPIAPVGPPAARVLLGLRQPGVGTGRQGRGLADPVAALLLQGWVDHAGDVPRGAEDEAALALEDGGGAIGPLPGHDVVFARGVEVGRRRDLGDIDLLAADRERARLLELVLEVGVAQVPAVHRSRQVGAVAVPVEQVEGRRRLALEVVADDVVPDQVVRPKEAEGRGQFLALEQAATAGALGADRHLAHPRGRFVDEDVEDAGFGEVEERGQEREARRRPLAARLEHRERSGEDGAADAEAQGVDLLAARDLLRQADRLDRRVLDVVVPGALGDLLAGVLPADDEHPVPFADAMADQRVLRLQVEDVELVDAGRHDQQRPLIDLRRERLVLEELEELVLEHHPAFGRGDIAADLERGLVGLREMTLLQVVPE